jgi:hypothetical protein
MDKLNALYDEIEKTNIFYLKEDTKLVFNNFIDKKLSCSFYKTKFDTNGIIARSGDILVGFYANTPTLFSLTANDEFISTYALEEDEFVYTINDKYIYPLIASSKTELFINNLSNPDGLYLVYAFVEDDIRKFLFENKLYYKLNGETWIFHNSIFYKEIKKIFSKNKLERFNILNPM